MSVWDDLSGPFKSWGNTWRNALTNPRALTWKDIPTLLFPVPGSGFGSTLTYDIDHPRAAVTQGAALAAVSGAYSLANPASVGWTEAGRSAAYWQSAEGQALTSLWEAPLTDAAAQSAIDEAAIQTFWDAPLSTEAGATSGSGIGSLIEGGVKKTAAVVKETAVVSAAAQQVLGVWKRAVNGVKEIVRGGSGVDGSTGQTVVVGGGPGGAGVQTPKAAAPGALVLVAGAAAAGLLVLAIRKARRA